MINNIIKNSVILKPSYKKKHLYFLFNVKVIKVIVNRCQSIARPLARLTMSANAFIFLFCC